MSEKKDHVGVLLEWAKGCGVGDDGKLVRLDLTHKHFDKEFVTKCVKDAVKLTLREKLGDRVSALEQLGLMVLMDSAGVAYEDSTIGEEKP